MSKKKKKNENDTQARQTQAPDTQATDEPTESAQEEKSPVQQRDELQERLLRTLADHDNYKKRVLRENTQARDFANESLVCELLAVVDDMERALEAAKENHGADDPLFQGMQLVHDKMMDILGKFGLSTIKAAGEPFDPEKHSAVMQEPTTAQPPMTVLRELQKGYEFKGRTIRPSCVVVSREPSQEDDANDADV